MLSLSFKRCCIGSFLFIVIWLFEWVKRSTRNWKKCLISFYSLLQFLIFLKISIPNSNLFFMLSHKPHDPFMGSHLTNFDLNECHSEGLCFLLLQYNLNCQRFEIELFHFVITDQTCSHISQQHLFQWCLFLCSKNEEKKMYHSFKQLLCYKSISPFSWAFFILLTAIWYRQSTVAFTYIHTYEYTVRNKIQMVSWFRERNICIHVLLI
jgi:hypothetical protein